MSAITLVSATVKYPAGKTFDTQYGQRINVVLALPDGTEHKEWSHPDDRFLRSLKKGDAVQVVKDGDRCKLLKAEDDLPPPLPANNHPPPPPPLGTTTNTRWSKEHKTRIAEEIKQRAALIGYCHAQVSEQFVSPDGEVFVGEETIQKYAAMLYLDIKELWK